MDEDLWTARRHAVFQRSSGVLLPLASLPGPPGIGDLGPAARDFVAWLGAAGQRWWQMLPVTPLGPGGSPYDSASAFAGEPAYLSLHDLAMAGLLQFEDIHPPKSLLGQSAKPDRAKAWKERLLRKAFHRWVETKGTEGVGFANFKRRNAHWLPAWERFEGREPGFTAFLQYLFYQAFEQLRELAEEHGVRLMGDVPIFVGADSADVQAAPQLFQLDGDGRPTVVSGCPPDAFSKSGQLWGHPHYDWEAHRGEDFAWWRARMARQLELFHAVRIDHFIGFQRAWEVPSEHRTARRGQWAPSDGRGVLEALVKDLGDLPLIAEDLGAVTPHVRALRDEFGLPGMRVLHWGFWPGSEHAPHRVPEHAVVYPGTHDNDTTMGWWRGLDSATKKRVRLYTGGKAETMAWDLWRTALGTAAHTAIVSLQDLLGLGRAARMNTPGTTSGNWRWRPAKSDLSKSLARRMRELTYSTDRLPRTP